MDLREIMTTGVELTNPQATLREAAEAMRDGDFGLLPVGENDRLVGVVTDRDIAIRGVAAGRDPNTTTVRDVMSEAVEWIFEDQPLELAAKSMRDMQIRRLPVLNRDKRLVGIVSLGDLAVEREGAQPAGEALSGVSQQT